MKKVRSNKNGITKTTIMYLWLYSLIHPQLIIALGRILGAIFTKFFFLQFQTVLFPKKRPVVNVDHILDENIPFDESRIGLYNTFTAFWMKSAGWLLKVFGKKAICDVAEFINELTLLYNVAAKVYEKCQSTTKRPGISANFNFIIIHMFDPHLHCVPSLHVMVCSYTAYKISEIIKKHSDTPEKYQSEINWSFKNASEIIESVLLVKQHSVNCISAGFFMNSALFENFEKEWAELFLKELYKEDSKNIKKVEAVQSHISNLYDKFLKEYHSGTEMDRVLLKFLESYKD